MKKVLDIYVIYLIIIATTSFSQYFSSLTDTRDGRVYKTAKIGEQEWLAENLITDLFRNGDPIPQVKTNEEWMSAIQRKTPAWCYYNNDSKNGAKYGKLYNSYAVSDVRGLPPVEWHVPSNEEWGILANFLGGFEKAGKKMKTNSGWFESGYGTNTSGFSGLPGGFRLKNGKFEDIEKLGCWWDFQRSDDWLSYTRDLSYFSDELYRTYDHYRDKGLSVRCIKN